MPAVRLKIAGSPKATIGVLVAIAFLLVGCGKTKHAVTRVSPNPNASTAAPRVDRFVAFVTPSRNIACGFVHDPTQTALRCDIQSGLQPPPSKPATCEFDWGQTLGMKRKGRASPSCVSDAIVGADNRGPHVPLAYGKLISVGGITCRSEFSGLRCVNKSRHGFFLSRERYRLF
jgi:uncharacterized protein DUF6636